jgi:hypothetical protein
MKKKLYLILCATTILNASIAFSSTHFTSENNSDPFLKTWLFNDGATLHKLIISVSSMPSQAYHVTYDSPDEKFESEMCKAVSGNTIQCLSGPIGVQLIRDDIHHLITVKSSLGETNYFDPNYMPALPAVLGTWTYTHHSNYDPNYTADFTVVIKGDSTPTKVRVDTYMTDTSGSVCNAPLNDIYSVTTNPDGTQTYINEHWHDIRGFVFDPTKNQLSRLPVNISKLDNFEIGFCVKTHNEAIFNRKS